MHFGRHFKGQSGHFAHSIVRILMLGVSADIVAVSSVLSVHIAWNFTRTNRSDWRSRATPDLPH